MNLQRLQELQDLLFEYQDVIDELRTDSIYQITNALIVLPSKTVSHIPKPAHQPKTTVFESDVRVLNQRKEIAKALVELRDRVNELAEQIK
jgi:hypothetical protein